MSTNWVGHLLASEYISAYHLLELLALLLAAKSETITRQIDYIPLLIDKKMIYKQESFRA